MKLVMKAVAPVSVVALCLVFVGCPEEDTEECYGPGLNLESAYEDGSVGCACEADSEDICDSYLREDGREHHVALICSEGFWEAVEDGPCMLAP